LDCSPRTRRTGTSERRSRRFCFSGTVRATRAARASVRRMLSAARWLTVAHRVSLDFRRSLHPRLRAPPPGGHPAGRRNAESLSRTRHRRRHGRPGRRRGRAFRRLRRRDRDPAASADRHEASAAARGRARGQGVGAAPSDRREGAEEDRVKKEEDGRRRRRGVSAAADRDASRESFRCRAGSGDAQRGRVGERSNAGRGRRGFVPSQGQRAVSGIRRRRGLPRRRVAARRRALRFAALRRGRGPGVRMVPPGHA
jgi:hypothetical protein